jgi:thioredoxin-like negative regulator of GroEL
MPKLIVKTFWSHDSGGSNIQVSLVKDLERLFKGRVVFEYINVEENKEQVEKYNVKILPSVILVYNDKERERFNGLAQELFLKKAIKKALSEIK